MCWYAVAEFALAAVPVRRIVTKLAEETLETSLLSANVTMSVQFSAGFIQSPGVSLSSDGVLRVGAGTSGTTILFVRIQNECSGEESLTVLVHLITAACPCVENNRVCVLPGDGTGQYECACATGFTGSDCAQDADNCTDANCTDGHGTCQDGINNYTCSCFHGYTGQYCEETLNFCESSPCQHGSCEQLVGAYRCSCDSGWTGAHCESDIVDCDNDSCANGRCVEGTGSFTCLCDPGFTGSTCNLGLVYLR